MSPSMRREWIEISGKAKKLYSPLSLPPCGGSGLKYPKRSRNDATGRSPSMRREWIEMQLVYSCRRWFCVSLHAEGVD